LLIGLNGYFQFVANLQNAFLLLCMRSDEGARYYLWFLMGIPAQLRD